MPDDSKAGRRGPHSAALGGVLAIGLLGLLAAAPYLSGSLTEPRTAAEPSCDTAAASATYGRAQASGLVRGVDMSVQDGVVVMVALRPWRRLRFAEQQELAAAIDCAISEGRGHLRELSFRVDRDGENLWRLDAAELLALRERSP